MCRRVFVCFAGMVAVNAALSSAVAQSSALVLVGGYIYEPFHTRPQELLNAGPWLGLFIADEVSSVVPTTVEWTEAAEDTATSYRVTTTPSDAAFLFSGVAGLRPGPAVTVGRWIGLDDKRHAILSLRGVYELRLETDSASSCDAVVKLISQGIEQVLFDLRDYETCDEPHFMIHWAGDLDGDGKLDLVTTFSFKYSVFPMQLFLSSEAGIDMLVSEVASFQRVSM